MDLVADIDRQLFAMRREGKTPTRLKLGAEALCQIRANASLDRWNPRQVEETYMGIPVEVVRGDHRHVSIVSDPNE